MCIILIKFIMLIICIFVIIIIMLIILLIWVCIELDFADHVQQDKRAAIAQEVDGLGDQFRPAICAGWLSYIKNTYPEGYAANGPSVGQGTLVVDD